MSRKAFDVQKSKGAFDVHKVGENFISKNGENFISIKWGEFDFQKVGIISFP